MWEHITPSDRKITLPPTSVLFRIHDARAIQFWDDERAMSRTMEAELPRDTLRSVAEVDTTGWGIPWDCVAIFGAGRRWEEHFPVPDWAGRTVGDAADTMLVRLRELERAAPADTARAGSH
jgi:hypothetical protein